MLQNSSNLLSDISECLSFSLRKISDSSVTVEWKLIKIHLTQSLIMAFGNVSKNLLEGRGKAGEVCKQRRVHVYFLEKDCQSFFRRWNQHFLCKCHVYIFENQNIFVLSSVWKLNYKLFGSLKPMFFRKTIIFQDVTKFKDVKKLFRVFSNISLW